MEQPDEAHDVSSDIYQERPARPGSRRIPEVWRIQIFPQLWFQVHTKCNYLVPGRRTCILCFAEHSEVSRRTIPYHLQHLGHRSYLWFWWAVYLPRPSCYTSSSCPLHPRCWLHLQTIFLTLVRVVLSPIVFLITIRHFISILNHTSEHFWSL